MDFYVDNNVMGVFHQGSREKGDEMADMRTYLLSRQMWDKDIDFEALMKNTFNLITEKHRRISKSILKL